MEQLNKCLAIFVPVYLCPFIMRRLLLVYRPVPFSDSVTFTPFFFSERLHTSLFSALAQSGIWARPARGCVSFFVAFELSACPTLAMLRLGLGPCDARSDVLASYYLL